MNVAKHIIGKAINLTFKQYFPDPNSRSEDEKSSYKSITDWFSKGNDVDISDMMSHDDYERSLLEIPGLKKLVQQKISSLNKEDLVCWMDMVVEALHQNSMLSKQDLDDHVTYSDMVGSMFSSFSDSGEKGFEDFDI